MSKLIGLVREEQRRRSSPNDLVGIHDDLPPCPPAMLAQILREIDGTSRGLPQAPNATDGAGE